MLNKLIMGISSIYVFCIMMMLWVGGAPVASLLFPMNLYIMHVTLNEMKEQKKEEKKCQE